MVSIFMNKTLNCPIPNPSPPAGGKGVWSTKTLKIFPIKNILSELAG